MQQYPKNLIISIVLTLTFLPTLSQAEWYIGGHAGYSKPNDLEDVKGVGSAKGITLSDLDLKDALGYGIKIGYFFPDQWNWLGVEFETFTSNPHIKQQSVTAGFGGSSSPLGTLDGSHFRVVTPALNLMFRFPGYYVEPYAGGGIGAFWGRISDSTGSDNDVSPGVNALAGLRFYINDEVALFTEYKYNYTKFKFKDSLFEATYSSHGLYGGISFHF